MAILIDSNGRDVQTQQEIARLRAEALAKPATEPASEPEIELGPSAPIELPATIDRRPAVTSAPATSAPTGQGNSDEMDAVYTANGGQLGAVVDEGARAVGVLPAADTFPETMVDTSTPESRLAGDGINGARGAGASAAFTAFQGMVTEGRVDVMDISGAVVAQGIDDIAAGVARSPLVGNVVKNVARIGPIAAVSTIAANVNAVIKEGGTRESIVQGVTHAGLDLAALGGAALAGTAVGGPVGAAVAVLGFTAYQLVGADLKAAATDAVNGAIDWVGGLFS